MGAWDIAVWRMLWPLWILFAIMSNGEGVSSQSEAPDETSAGAGLPLVRLCEIATASAWNGNSGICRCRVTKDVSVSPNITTLLTPCALAFWLLAPQVVASVLVFCLYDYSRLVSCSDTVAQKPSFVENLMSFTGDTTFISGQLRVA